MVVASITSPVAGPRQFRGTSEFDGGAWSPFKYSSTAFVTFFDIFSVSASFSHTQKEPLDTSKFLARSRCVMGGRACSITERSWAWREPTGGDSALFFGNIRE